MDDAGKRKHYNQDDMDHVEGLRSAAADRAPTGARLQGDAARGLGSCGVAATCIYTRTCHVHSLAHGALLKHGRGPVPGTALPSWDAQPGVEGEGEMGKSVSGTWIWHCQKARQHNTQLPRLEYVLLHLKRWGFVPEVSAT